MEGNPQSHENMPSTQSSERGIDASILFGKNHHFAFIYRKTEKLVTAVYLITDFIKDEEPLKWKIRENAISLMSLNIAFSTVSLAERKSLIREYHSLALEIVSLSGVAQHSGLISEMNFSVLSREFGNLVSIIDKDENKKANEETVILDPGFFSAYEPKAETSPASSPASVLTPATFPKGHAPQIKDIQEKPAQPARFIEKASEPKDGKDSRRNAITKLLSKKSGLGIKDFAMSIKGVSEKTIQRELLAMVAQGLLKKEGERRWSTYSLAN